MVSRSSNLDITQSVPDTAAARGSQSIMEFLLERSNLAILPAKSVDLAAGNEYDGESTIRYISSRQALSITEDTLIKAALNCQNGLVVMKLLLSSPERHQLFYRESPSSCN